MLVLSSNVVNILVKQWKNHNKYLVADLQWYKLVLWVWIISIV